MKNFFLILICVIAVNICHYEAYGLTCNTNKALCGNAVYCRIQLLSDYYSGKNSITYVKEKLKKYESKYLLEKDIELIKKYDNTDIDRIKSFKIRSNVIKACKNNIVNGTIQIRYKMENCFRTYYKTVNYNYRCILIKKNSIKKIKILYFAV